MAKKIYDPEILKKIKEHELIILKDFIKICEENNLTYFGFWGTGIGALRHGGFIPWDDDIDLLIFRKDYEKAIEILKRDYKDKYTVVNAEEFDEYPVMNTHIILNGSRFTTTEELKLKYPQGIFLDVFPLDEAPADEKERMKHIKKAWFVSKLLIMKHIPFPKLPFRGFTAKLAHCVSWVAWLFLHFVSHKTLYNKAKKLSTKYNGQETGYYAYCFDTGINSAILEKDDIFPIRKIKFEGLDVCFPNKLEEGLTAYFGDFMQLPPEDKRVNHCPDIIEFPENIE